MRRFRHKSVAAMLLAAANILVASPAAAADVSVRTLAAEEMRLATIAYRMASASADLCRRPEMMTGMIVHDLSQYQPSRRAAVSRAFALGSGIGVLQIVANSAAQRTGLHIDDEILAVGNTSVEDAGAVQSNGATPQRIEAFEDLLQSRLSYGATNLLIRRNGVPMRLTMVGERGCGGRLSLVSGGRLNAWADGRRISVTTGMDGFARSDDEIAFVIAHEMSHNILGHFGSTETLGIFGAARSRNYELEADGYAVRLMGAAGYQPAAGIRFLERSQRRLWWAFSLDHPGFGSRIRTVALEIGRWQQMRPAYREALAVQAPAVIAAAGSVNAPINPTIATQSTLLPASAQLAQSTPSWSQAGAWRMPGRMLQP